MSKCPIVLAVCAALAVVQPVVQPVHAKIGADPVGKIAQTGRYSGGRNILIGRDAGGGTVCFRREEGDSHRLDIGIGAMGAFVRLDTAEPREALPGLPVRVYAGVEEVRNDRSTGRFTSLLALDGDVVYIVPDRKLARFVLIAPGDADRFLAVVAAARRNFLVVEQRTGDVRDYVAVYEFDRAAAEALRACHRQQGS